EAIVNLRSPKGYGRGSSNSLEFPRFPSTPFCLRQACYTIAVPQVLTPQPSLDLLMTLGPGLSPSEAPEGGTAGMTSLEPCPEFFCRAGPDTAFFGRNRLRPFTLGESRRPRVRLILADKSGHGRRPALDFPKTVRAAAVRGDRETPVPPPIFPDTRSAAPRKPRGCHGSACGPASARR